MLASAVAYCPRHSKMVTLSYAWVQKCCVSGSHLISVNTVAIERPPSHSNIHATYEHSQFLSQHRYHTDYHCYFGLCQSHLTKDTTLQGKKPTSCMQRSQ
jgi:hypothetical protein